MPIIKFTPASLNDLFDNWPSHWPEKSQYVNEHVVRRDQCDGFRSLLDKEASETEIERFLSANREALVLLLGLFHTGHHAAWVYPKRHIRPSSDGPGGQIPDYVLAGANSDGVSWFIVELKGANHKAFTKQNKRVFLSPEANRGVCQLLTYIDLSAKAQSYLRDELKMTGFREPRGVLVIGRETETNDEMVRDFKASWNRTNPRLMIRSYDALLRQVERKLNDFER